MSSAPQVSRTTVSRLEGGLPVVTSSSPVAASATLALWWRGGSRSEGAASLGAHHLLEHLMSRERSQRDDVFSFVESIGGVADAYTSKQHVAFLLHVPRDDAVETAGRMGHQFAALRFGSEELAAEKEAIGRELQLAAADPSDRIIDLANCRLFRGDALGWPTGGTAESVGALGDNELRRFHAARFHAGTVAVVCAGGISSEELVAALDRTPLAGLEAGCWEPEGAPTTAGAVALDPATVPAGTCHLVFASRAPGLGDDDLAAVEVLTVLTEAQAYEALRLETGLTYETWTQHVPYRGTGQWRTYVATSSDARARVEEEMGRLVDRWRKGDFGEGACERARRRAAGRFRLSLEQSATVAMWLGERLVTARDPDASPGRHARALSRVTQAELERVADRMFGNGCQETVLEG